MLEKGHIEDVFLTLINSSGFHKAYYYLVAAGKITSGAEIYLSEHLSDDDYHSLNMDERDQLRQRVFEYYVEEACLKPLEDTPLKKTAFGTLRDDALVREEILKAVAKYGQEHVNGKSIYTVARRVKLHEHMVRLNIDVSDIVQIKYKLVTYFMDRAVNNETPPKPEEEIKMKEYTVVTKTFIGNVEASELTDDQIFAAIREIETTIGSMDAIKSKPKKLQAKIDSLKETIKGLVAYVDAR